MDFTISTIPELLYSFKNIDLNNAILERLNGRISASSNLKSVLKDIYNKDLTLNKDTISVFLRTCEDPFNLDNLNVEDRKLTNEAIIGLLVERLNLEDLLKLKPVIEG